MKMTLFKLGLSYEKSLIHTRFRLISVKSLAKAVLGFQLKAIISKLKIISLETEDR